MGDGLVAVAREACYDEIEFLPVLTGRRCLLLVTAMSTSFLSDQLLAQAVAGDHAALERLLLLYYDRLAARIGRMLPDDVRSQLGVEDVLQDTFVQAFRDIGAFR